MTPIQLSLSGAANKLRENHNKKLTPIDLTVVGDFIRNCGQIIEEINSGQIKIGTNINALASLDKRYALYQKFNIVGALSLWLGIASIFLVHPGNDRVAS